MDVNDDDVKLTKEEKKAKKAAKKKRKLEQTEQVDEINNTEISPEIIAEISSDKKKKKKKRDSNSIEVVGDVLIEEATVEKKKKKKKNKKDSDISHLDEISVVSKFPLSNHLPNFVGDYMIHSQTAAMTHDNIKNFRSEAGIEVNPEEDSIKYNPITSFDYLNPSLGRYCNDVKNYITTKKFTVPSPIQAQCWPPLLDGRDVIGIASTGSGKTLAFLIPALLKLEKTNNSQGLLRGKGLPAPRMLIMAPTRELAMQSYQVVLDIGGIRAACIYGGMPKGPQKAELRNGADIVVATPGRLLDLLEENALSLSGILYAVLDEADRMLDEGFEPAIRQILGACPTSSNGRQTVMFSATWPEEIRALADKFLKREVVRVTVGGDELSANHKVTQIVECIEPPFKDRRLIALLEKYHQSRTNRCLIFVLYKKEAVTLQNTLIRKGYNVTAIHGDKGQVERSSALEEFKSGRIPLLIATDVAARGLDIPQVEYVINYSFPLTVEDYVHRIGRTGRGGATGISHTFFTDFDKSLAGALVAVLQDAKQEVPKEIYKYPLITKKAKSKLYGDFGPKTELAGKKATKIVFE